MKTDRIKRNFPGWGVILIVVVLAFGLGYLLRGIGGGSGPVSQGMLAGSENHHSSEEPSTAQAWTCSMHPQIQLPDFGKCPICFMDLIPVTQGATEDSDAPVLELSPAAAALADIQTARVARQHLPVAVRLVGKVAYDETRFRAITARVAGRLDSLRVDFTGTEVRRGQSLAAVYSPELYAAQVELLSALQTAREVKEGGGTALQQTTDATVAAVRNRLRLWGLTPQQISAIEKRGAATEHLNITSPLGGTVVRKQAIEGSYVTEGTEIYAVADLSQVWVNLQAYEKDLVWIRVGQQVTFEVAALTGQTFQGRVAFIDPTLDVQSRTVRVRLDVDNQDRLLKPGMYVSAVISSPASEESPPLVIPATAPLLTGKRAVVYVRLPDTERPTFAGREIQLGPRTGDHYVVKAGLSEGEEVVVKGNFKIDSELQIRALPSMMSPATSGDGASPVASGARVSPAKPEKMVSSTIPTDGVQALATPEMFQDRLGEILDNYLEIQTALAADDDARAAKAAAAAAGILAGVEGSCLDATAQASWASDREQLTATLADVRKAPDVASRRKAFLPLSTELWRILRTYGYRETEPVRWINCPMAFANAGADWIQRQASVANPYYGASMLRCGSQVDSIAAKADDPGGP
jgi:Cu(I)/Ag(I) efflux system membrane fusion protein